MVAQKIGPRPSASEGRLRSEHLIAIGANDCQFRRTDPRAGIFDIAAPQFPENTARPVGKLQSYSTRTVNGPCSIAHDITVYFYPWTNCHIVAAPANFLSFDVCSCKSFRQSMRRQENRETTRHQQATEDCFYTSLHKGPPLASEQGRLTGPENHRKKPVLTSSLSQQIFLPDNSSVVI